MSIVMTAQQRNRMTGNKRLN